MSLPLQTITMVAAPPGPLVVPRNSASSASPVAMRNCREVRMNLVLAVVGWRHGYRVAGDAGQGSEPSASLLPDGPSNCVDLRDTLSSTLVDNRQVQFPGRFRWRRRRGASLNHMGERPGTITKIIERVNPPVIDCIGIELIGGKSNGLGRNTLDRAATPVL